ncbi:hypothetical protein TIFTF001_034949 [Ficus carica]|uniref:Uncharacterized protein n=1 Tax=Ficus carica TaxID=3494 RepID=A0AA87Z2V3_FICCA|nr:hypothetical protein TIFTF001_043618 [Ficus carica]GMN23040.1 hypothetical protein TIFTF001_043619 [Ficus carica]GMN23051.1 hypothetical protein TIFTF001_043626 [Ficus carica]GMN23067.1 hypothetical protein TIFTF001_043627 [Ficus carica]GMN65878.1 hypothetical protein TIFTF001_034949 [Ficus carica]
MMCPLLEMAGLRWSIELALASQQARLACLPSKAIKHEVSSPNEVQIFVVCLLILKAKLFTQNPYVVAGHSCPILPSSKAREACSSRLGTMRCPLPGLAGLRWSLELALANQ